MVEPEQWMERVANLLGEREMPKEWAEKLEPYRAGGIRPAYAAALMRQWLSGAATDGRRVATSDPLMAELPGLGGIDGLNKDEA